MRIPENRDEHFIELTQRMHGLASKIIANLKPDGETLRLDNASDLLNSQPATRIFWIKSGYLNCIQDNKLTHIAETGDLIGFARSLKLPEGTYTTDAPIELIPFQRDELMSHVTSSVELQKHWVFYLTCQATFFSEALTTKTMLEYKPSTGFLYFEKDENIILQDDSADCVYTLLEGNADAFHDGIKVGEIYSGEIFGAMSVFTQLPRNATVTASSDCTVLAVKKEEFLELIAHNPKICLDLLEEMADKINQLNKQVSNIQGQA
ncbi:MAG: cyclic nucleotide-binding domain-containing protein [Cellvibrionaceae bacterium]